MPLRRFLPQLAASMLLALFLAVASAQTTLIHGFNAPTLPVFATLTNFDGTNGASAAETSLIQGADGNFYGVAEVGGANSAGTVAGSARILRRVNSSLNIPKSSSRNPMSDAPAAHPFACAIGFGEIDR